MLVFDLDGTLVDSLSDLADSVNFVLARYTIGPLPMSSIRDFVGNGAPELLRRSFRLAGIEQHWQEALPEYLGYYQEHCLSKTRLYPGIREMLERLSNRVTSAVLTNKPSASTNYILESLQVREFFKMIAAADNSPARKPDPRGLQSIMNQLQIPPLHTLMVGDSEVDMETGRRAGAWTCAAAWGMKSDEIRHADITASRPEELEHIINTA